jgi:DNA polymerase-3 subunit epsilon
MDFMLKHLCLERALTFVDVETTGVDPRRDRMVEVALVRLAPGTAPRTLELRLNPQCPIPAAANAVHGIRDEDVAGCPTFAERADAIAGHIGTSDLAGFGVARFDLPFLVAEFARVGREVRLQGRKVVDALALFHRLEPRDLAAAVRRYCGHVHTCAHRARDDALAAAAVLDGMLAEHADLPRGVPELHDRLIPVDIEGWFTRREGAVFLARGKHRDVPLAEVAQRDPSYLAWLTHQAMPDARRLIEEVLARAADG